MCYHNHVLYDNTAIYVSDDRPTAEPHYRARFYFDPNSIKMASGDTFLLLDGLKGSFISTLRVEFRQSSGAYQVRARLLNDSLAWIKINWSTLSDATHFI